MANPSPGKPGSCAPPRIGAPDIGRGRQRGFPSDAGHEPHLPVGFAGGNVPLPHLSCLAVQRK
eukprot:1672957-Pyramimonas_sp.AAC.1